MLKQDLKDGMILETRNGDRYLFINGNILGLDGFLGFLNYSEDLKNELNKDYDVVKVYKVNECFYLTDIFEDRNLTLLWERKEIKLTDREIEVLKALKTLGYEWLARDEDGDIHSHDIEPVKITSYWFSYNHWYPMYKDRKLFNFIKWEDKEPTKIDDLLKGI